MMHSLYMAFHPLAKLKGWLCRVRSTRLTSQMRLIYLNPIEGLMTLYAAEEKYPHVPHSVIELEHISVVELMEESKWYCR
mmetsp:Transcript_36401/g.47773  ORF Transcript_36401/g.47773 Transcript_36401/m.47773 type:complete len:80 (+) Transcript_36401:181-420(+)